MTTIKNEAQAYEPKQTKNIADLDKISVNVQIEAREGARKDGTPFTYKAIVIGEHEYRVPNIVLGNLKDLLEANPNMTHFRVIKKGSGLETRYTLVPIMEGGNTPSPSYPKVMDVMMPHNSDTQKKAYADLLQTKAVLHDKFLLGMLTTEQHAEMVSLAHEEYSSKCL